MCLIKNLFCFEYSTSVNFLSVLDMQFITFRLEFTSNFNMESRYIFLCKHTVPRFSTDILMGRCLNFINENSNENVIS